MWDNFTTFLSFIIFLFYLFIYHCLFIFYLFILLIYGFGDGAWIIKKYSLSHCFHHNLPLQIVGGDPILSEKASPSHFSCDEAAEFPNWYIHP